jgi:hypothetical protein
MDDLLAGDASLLYADLRRVLQAAGQAGFPDARAGLGFNIEP